MADRFYVEQPITGERARLAGAEVHHLVHVMRARSGDRVTLFDGTGCEFEARIEEVGRSEIELAVLGRTLVDRELPLELSLAVALPKGDRARWLVEKSVELGVTRLVPLETARGVAQPLRQALDRLRRTVIEASKQCGRNRLLEIAPPEPWLLLAGRPAPPGCYRGVAHPTGATRLEALADRLRASRPPPSLWLAVGPEGGFTEEEVEAALHAGWEALSLGPRTLRVETAALLLASLAAAVSK